MIIILKSKFTPDIQNNELQSIQLELQEKLEKLVSLQSNLTNKDEEFSKMKDHYNRLKISSAKDMEEKLSEIKSLNKNMVDMQQKFDHEYETLREEIQSNVS